MSIVYADFHAISYGFLQAISLYRSVVFYDDPVMIMFTGYECYAITWTVGAAKMLMSFIQTALTIERIIDRIIPLVPKLKPFKRQGLFLNAFALTAGISTTIYSYSEGPTGYKLASCFMQKDIPLDRVLYTLGMYFALSLLCLLANLTIIFSIFKSSKKSFNLKIRFNFQEVKNSSFAVSLISVFQFVAMTAYVASSLIVIYYRRDIPHEYFHNIILCIYTIPYGGLCLPLSVIYCTKWISDHRKIQIVQMTNTNRTETMDGRMSQLKNAWDSLAPSTPTKKYWCFSCFLGLHVFLKILNKTGS